VNIRDFCLLGAWRLQGRMRPDPVDPVIQSPNAGSGHAISDLFERLVAEPVKHGADDDRIAAALEQATQAAADVRAERLWAGPPHMLREHRDFRRGFEGSLQQGWVRL
jgi:hypothetical protein